MDNAMSLLFKQPIEGRPLFKNQQDLVNQLLQDPDSLYYVEPSDLEKYNLIQNRLKAYVSQLLSPNVTRNITTDFEGSLNTLIHKKVRDKQYADSIISQILIDLRTKKAATPKVETRSSILDQLTQDFKFGQYISIITSRPLEVEAEMISDRYSLRKLVFEDFIETLTSPDKLLKDYRFNFPVDSSGSLFWKGINKLLFRHIKGTANKKDFFELVQKKLSIQLELNNDLFSSPLLNDVEILKISELILRALRAECKIAVFTCEAPIFTLPLIVIDPAETKNAKVYAIIDTDDNNFNVHKFSNEEVVLWRLFVWDKIKSQAYCGKMVEFENK